MTDSIVGHFFNIYVSLRAFSHFKKGLVSHYCHARFKRYLQRQAEFPPDFFRLGTPLFLFSSPFSLAGDGKISSEFIDRLPNPPDGDKFNAQDTWG